MSLLMQALRKAERAKHGEILTEPHDESRLQLEPLQTDVQKPAAGSESAASGGTGFTLEPLEPPSSPLAEEDIPVIAATEAMHDPVPPQARPGLRAAVDARTAAEARRATDMPHGPGVLPGGLSAMPPPHAAPHSAAAHSAAAPAGSAGYAAPAAPAGLLSGTAAESSHGASVDDTFFAERPALRSSVPPSSVRAPGSASDHLGRPQPGHGPAPAGSPAAWGRTGAAPRASAAASRQRLAVLGGLLAVVAIGFGYMYWRGISSPGAGAALPPVPMPAPGAVAVAPGAASGIAPGTMIPGVEPAQPAPGTLPAAAPAGAALADTASGVAPPAPGGTTGAPVATAAAPRAPTRVIIPTPEALAAIEDPAIRAEAMRDSAERAARAARAADVAHHGGVQNGPEAPVLAAASNPSGATVSESPGSTNKGSRALRSSSAAAQGARVNISGGTPGESGAADVHIVRNNITPQVSPTLQNAWSAYQAGDLAAARQQYDMALLQDPNNRDALLGSAAVALKEHNGQQAAVHYVRLLELNPNDPEALSGLVALRPGDLAQAETKLKGLLRSTPESGPVLFTLGNLYAKQGRWSEAQQAYFRAYSAAPANPDYAFNLAIGLDRLNQGRLAQDYYQRALNLAQNAPAGFDPNAVRKRLAELGAPSP
jgi:tetratricopeptide (TPR) repeat protein